MPELVGLLAPAEADRLRTAWDALNVQSFDFHYQLCGNIRRFEQRTASGDTVLADPDIGLDDMRVVATTYQITEMVGLVGLVLATFSSIGSSGAGTVSYMVTKVSKTNARMWGFSATHYVILGESLVATMVEMLGRTRFSTAVEICWIDFYNRLARIVLERGKDPSWAEIAASHTRSGSSPGNRASFGDQLTVSLLLSLLANDDLASVCTLSFSPLKPVPLDDVDSLNETASDDDAFDLLNSFDTPKYTEKIKHSGKRVSSSKTPPSPPSHTKTRAGPESPLTRIMTGQLAAAGPYGPRQKNSNCSIM